MTIFEISIFWITIAPSYYWLMYALGFIVGYFILKKRDSFLSSLFASSKYQSLEDLLFYIFLWVILWGRFGYIIFYDLYYYLSNILFILMIRLCISQSSILWEEHNREGSDTLDRSERVGGLIQYYIMTLIHEYMFIACILHV